ncbi:MAG: peptide chain release factor N(5)-glutamine methyltransferase [Alphaproteobacteria bacterium]|nr:peptide chain release factor N(5)-glutamine methyltransferase [Alphaproteobacteria bacterium]
MKINQAFTILQSAGGIRAARIITDKYKNLSKIRTLWMARQLRRGVPVAKIIHQKWFYGLSFYTNKFTLDPRPDTETVVAAVIADCPGNTPRRILDLGTGTGCILGALVKNIPESVGVGIDRSYGAVRVARRNMRMLGLGRRVTVLWRSFGRKKMPGAPFDIIVSNPPYIARGDTRVNDAARHDPAGALYAGAAGLAAYKTIANNAVAWLRDGGRIYLEIGDGMGADVRDIFTRAGWTFVRAESDLGGIERALVFEK